MERLKLTCAILLVSACLATSASKAQLGNKKPIKTGESNVTEPLHVKSGTVDFGPDEQAPEAPDVGVAISLLTGSKVARFSGSQPIMLHGSYKADMALVRVCREGLGASILVTLIRTDKPWGKTLRLVTPQALTPRPAPLDSGEEHPHYREGGQFKLDLAKFFGIAEEAGTYQVEAILGPYHSQRLEFEVR